MEEVESLRSWSFEDEDQDQDVEIKEESDVSDAKNTAHENETMQSQAPKKTNPLCEHMIVGKNIAIRGCEAR